MQRTRVTLSTTVWFILLCLAHSYVESSPEADGFNWSVPEDQNGETALAVSFGNQRIPCGQEREPPVNVSTRIQDGEPAVHLQLELTRTDRGHDYLVNVFSFLDGNQIIQRSAEKNARYSTSILALPCWGKYPYCLLGWHRLSTMVVDVLSDTELYVCDIEVEFLPCNQTAIMESELRTLYPIRTQEFQPVSVGSSDESAIPSPCRIDHGRAYLQLPKWASAYASFHRAAKVTRSQLLVWTCRPAGCEMGIGNKFSAILAAAAYAIGTGRVLLIDFDVTVEDMHLWQYLCSPHIAWDARPHSNEWRRSTRTVKHVSISHDKDFEMLIAANVTADVLVVTWSTASLAPLLTHSNGTFRARLGSPSNDTFAIFVHHLSALLFHPTGQLADQLQQRFDSWPVEKNNSELIGVHLRRCYPGVDSCGWNAQKNDSVLAMETLSCIKSVLADPAHHNSRVVIVSNSREAKILLGRMIGQLFPSAAIVSTRDPLTAHSLWGADKTLSQREALILSLLVDMLSLSACSHVIITAGSTFSAVGALMATHHLPGITRLTDRGCVSGVSGWAHQWDKCQHGGKILGGAAGCG